MPTSSITAGYSASTEGTSKTVAVTDDVGFVFLVGQKRTAQRYSPSFPTSHRVTQILLEITDNFASGGGNTTVGLYGSVGDDPSADSAATFFSRCANAAPYITISGGPSTGTAQYDITTAQSIADLEAAVDAGSFFSLAIRNASESGVESESLDSATGTVPPRIIVTHAGGVSKMMMGVGT